MRLQPDPALVLRDIHQPLAPSWWPPAPGWWIVATVLLLVAATALWFAWRRHHRRRALERLFDDSVRAAPTPAAQVAAISELLRRAARRRDPQADKLQGDDWLRFLDRGSKQALCDKKGLNNPIVIPSAARDLLFRRVKQIPRFARDDRTRLVKRFHDEDARLLLDGGFRPKVDADAVAALLPRARACFLEWMAAR